MSTGWIIFIVVLVILIAVLVALYIFGKRMQKRQDEQKAQMEAVKQTFTILVIDKKKLRLKDAGLPQSVIDSTPKLLRRSKVPVVKAKIGPQIMNLIADDKVYDLIPLKKEVKATISGIYITDVKGVRGAVLVSDKASKKKGKFGQFVDKLQEKAGATPLK